MGINPAANKQFGVRGGVARRNLCAILQVLLPPEPQWSASHAKLPPRCRQCGESA